MERRDADSHLTRARAKELVDAGEDDFSGRMTDAEREWTIARAALDRSPVNDVVRRLAHEFTVYGPEHGDQPVIGTGAAIPAIPAAPAVETQPTSVEQSADYRAGFTAGLAAASGIPLCDDLEWRQREVMRTAQAILSGGVMTIEALRAIGLGLGSEAERATVDGIVATAISVVTITCEAFDKLPRPEIKVLEG